MSKLLLEMAKLCDEIVIKRIPYEIHLHGMDDRIYPPHIHIYKQNDKNFSIEINLAHYLNTGGQIQYCMIIDKSKNIKLSSPDDCLKFKGIHHFTKAIEDWLKETPKKKIFSNCRDNLEAVLKVFADEADMNQLHNNDKKLFSKKYGSVSENMKPEYKLIFVMKSMNKHIHKKFYNYFDSTIIKEFPKVFNNSSYH